MTAVIVSVLIMMILGLMRVNVLISIILAALSAGVLSGLSLVEATNMMISGIGGQAETAIAIVLLGVFAAMIGHTNITGLLVNWILKMVKSIGGKKGIIVLLIAGISCFSQNLVPVHIAFIPILIPPLLHLFNKMKIDRRAVATALQFGLKAPYIMLPVGYGLVYHGIIANEMEANGMEIALSQVPLALLLPGIGMIFGLLFAIFVTYRKDKEITVKEEIDYSQQTKEEISAATEETHFNKVHWITLAAIIVALGVQVTTESLVLGALAGIVVMFLGRAVPVLKGNDVIEDGVKMMGTIAFVLLIAAGYSTILQETGAVDELVSVTDGFLGGSKLLASFVILLIGLFITMGIGTSFGTIPIIAAVYVPICLTIGFSPLATAALIGTAGALGDAGSPASDSTLGPTAGLNVDGQHDHMWGTCVPGILHFNIPLIIFGMIAANIL